MLIACKLNIALIPLYVSCIFGLAKLLTSCIFVVNVLCFAMNLSRYYILQAMLIVMCLVYDCVFGILAVGQY